MKPSPILDTAVRFLFPSILVLSLYFLFAGHNQPGGGFAGGLLAGAALALRYVASGLAEVRRIVPVSAWSIAGVGLLIATSTAIVPLLVGGDVLEHDDVAWTLPLLGEAKFTTALVFDVGVYVLVVGVILLVVEAFGVREDES